MPDSPKYCPKCRRTFEWFEAECPADHVRLVSHPDHTPEPDAKIVPVLRTSEPAAAPLAKSVLEQDQIQYVERDAGLDDVRDIWGTSATNTPIEILVSAEDAERARELVRAALEEGGIEHVVRGEDEHDDSADIRVGEATRATDKETTVGSSSGTVRLYLEGDEGAPIGQIGGAQLRWLHAHLERESDDDRDYYFDADTIDMLEEAKGDPALIALLRRTLGNREGVTIRWARSRTEA